MTDFYMDGFDHYGSGDVSATNMVAAYTDVQNIIGTAPTYCGVPSWGTAATGPYCLVSKNAVSPTKTYAVRYSLVAPLNKCIVSLRYAMDSLPANNATTSIIDFRDNTNIVMAYLAVTTTGTIQLRDKFNAVIATSTISILPQTFNFLEMYWDVTTTTFTLRINDTNANLTPAITVVNANIATLYQLGIIPSNDTNSADATLFQFQYVDDLYIRTSSTGFDTWYGDRRVMWLPASKDTTINGWTPQYYSKISSGILTGTSTNSAVVTTANSSLDISSSGDFTIESFVRFNVLPSASAYSTIISRWDAINSRKSYRLVLGGSSFNNSSIQFDYSINGSSTITPIAYPFAPELNRWYHIAIVRSSGNILLFIDGVKLGLPIPDSNIYFSGGTEPLVLGLELTGTSTPVANSKFTGWLDETRITIGFARYTASFTPTTVPFPRGSGLDPHWSSVKLLCGYDTTISDESSFTQTLTSINGAVQFSPIDGPGVGVFSTVGKSIPDDNTCITASVGVATNILTMTTQPSVGDTVRVGTKTGPAAAIYTFKSALTTAFDVLIDTTAQNTLLNLLNAINLGPGIGTKYGTGTTANLDVTAIQLPVGQIQVTAIVADTGGNSIISTATGTAATWATATLTGGTADSTRTNFRFASIPANIPVISGIQIIERAWSNQSFGETAGRAGIITSTGVTYLPSIGFNPVNTIVTYATPITNDPNTGGLLSPGVVNNSQLIILRDF